MDKRAKIIVVFSKSFPYKEAKEFTFFKDEIPFLCSHFDQVFFVPHIAKGEKYDFILDPKIKVDTSFSEAIHQIGLRFKMRTLLSPLLWKELFSINFNFKKFKYSLSRLLASKVTENWISKFADKNQSDISIYSFWLDFTSLGAIFARRRNKTLKIFSRCHNFDLYGNKDNYYYVPFQKVIVNNVDIVFPDSYNGANFIKDNFPNANCLPGIMGTSKPLFKNIPSKDGKIRMISCSNMIPRKRVDLLFNSIFLLAKNNPNLSFEWHHIGDGPMWDKINTLIDVNKEKNLKVNLIGRLNYGEMMSFYEKTPLDLFINVSEKEGTPVSLIEAISCHIPVAVTAFGGNKEIAERGAGITFSENPDKEEIVFKLAELIKSKRILDYRKESYEVWNNYYNSEINYKKFIESILSFNS